MGAGDIKPTQRLCAQWYRPLVYVVACTHQVIKRLPEPPCRSSGPPALEGVFGRCFEAMDRYPYACVCHGHMSEYEYIRMCVCVFQGQTHVKTDVCTCFVCVHARARGIHNICRYKCVCARVMSRCLSVYFYIYKAGMCVYE